MISSVASSGQRLAQHDHRVEQHADRDEEQHREGIAQRQRLLRRALAQLRFAQDHAGEEGAERERDVEQRRRAEGDAERDRQHGQAEQLARAGMRDVVQDPRDHPPADHQHDRDEGRDLADRDQRAAATSAAMRRRAAPAAQRCRRQRRQQHQRQDHREVLDDQPADRDAAALGLEQPALLQGAQQHHRAGDRQREAEDEAGADRPAEQPGQAHAEQRSRLAICAIAPGTAIARTDSRSSSEKCSPTPNISRMTPISASSLAMPWSATKPGVKGPISTPASR